MPRGQQRKGNGAGWGGPAKGASTAPASIQTAPQITAENNPRNNVNDSKARRRERAMQILEDAMEGGETWQVRVMAADKMLDRVEGKAVQRTMDMRTELERLTDEQLDRAIAEIRDALGGDIGASGAGADAPEVGKPAGGVSAVH